MFTHGPSSVIDGDIMFWEETDFAKLQDDDFDDEIVKVLYLMNVMNIVNESRGTFWDEDLNWHMLIGAVSQALILEVFCIHTKGSNV